MRRRVRAHGGAGEDGVALGIPPVEVVADEDGGGGARPLAGGELRSAGEFDPLALGLDGDRAGRGGDLGPRLVGPAGHAERAAVGRPDDPQAGLEREALVRDARAPAVGAPLEEPDDGASADGQDLRLAVGTEPDDGASFELHLGASLGPGPEPVSRLEGEVDRGGLVRIGLRAEVLDRSHRDGESGGRLGGRLGPGHRDTGEQERGEEGWQGSVHRAPPGAV